MGSVRTLFLSTAVVLIGCGDTGPTEEVSSAGESDTTGSLDVDTDTDAASDESPPSSDSDFGGSTDSESEPAIADTATAGTDTDADADADADADTDTDADADTDSETATDTICSEQSFEIQYMPSKLMIALDMSGSMIIVDGEYSTKKYEAVKAAMQGMLSKFAGRFYFGFDAYPDYVDGDCVVSEPVQLDCAAHNEETISAWFDEHLPERAHGDPLLLEMEILMSKPDYAPNFTSTRLAGDPYLLVVSDGGDACGPTGVYDYTKTWTNELGEAAARLNDVGIRTIVVGYAEAAEGEVLDAIARNGGTPFDTYIPAVDQAALEAALETIAGAISSCAFEVDDPGPSSDPSKVNFYMNGTVVPFDDGCRAGTGWTWQDAAHTRMRFCDAPCEQLRDGFVSNIDAKFGCPVVIVV